MEANYIKNPILITGIERSGSSMIAKILESCGAFAGKTTPMHENVEIKKIVDRYYENVCKVPHFGQYPLPNPKKLIIPYSWKNSIETSLVFTDEYKGEKPWMYKSSRIGQIWPVWNYAYPEAKWIIVRRRTGDIIHSCMKTGFMVAFSNKLNQRLVDVNSEQEGWLWWVHEQEKVLYDMMQSTNCRIVWPERIANGEYDQIKDIVKWLGLQWNEEVVNSVSVLLKHSIQKERSK
jgi:hypothetical protein